MTRLLRYIFVAAFLVATVLEASADGRSEEVLSALSTRIAAMGPYSVAFSAEAGETVTEGRYRVNGNSYRMELPQLEVVSDGRTKYEINHGDEEIVMDRVDNSSRDIFANPVRAFDFAGEMFNSSYEGVKSVAGRECHVVRLTPTGGSAPAYEITLAVGVSSGLPVEVSYRSSGMTDRIVVSIVEFVSDRESTPALFRVDTASYPGYELIDFR